MKDFPRLIQYAFIYTKNYLLESLAIYFPKIIPKPLYIGLSVGTNCNFECKQCDLWKIKIDPKKRLKTNETKKILEDLRDWLGPFRLVFTGAEPFLRKDLFEILTFAAGIDVYTVITTNGWLINKKRAKNIVNSGLNVFNISLDGARRITHDNLRGKKGAQLQAIRALKLTRKARSDKQTPVIYINTVVMELNVDELVALAKLAKKEKLDGIRFQALESKHLFGTEKYNSTWFKNNPLWPKNPEKLAKVLDKLVQLKKQGWPIKNGYRELDDLKLYYRNPLEIAKRYQFCFTGVRNFSIDSTGKVKLCFGMKPVGDVLKQKPREIWHGKEASELRGKIRLCQRYCRILPCNKREEPRQLINAFFKGLAS